MKYIEVVYDDVEYAWTKRNIRNYMSKVLHFDKDISFQDGVVNHNEDNSHLEWSRFILQLGENSFLEWLNFHSYNRDNGRVISTDQIKKIFVHPKLVTLLNNMKYAYFYNQYCLVIHFFIF
jgi:hypothetical protein